MALFPMLSLLAATAVAKPACAGLEKFPADDKAAAAAHLSMSRPAAESLLKNVSRDAFYRYAEQKQGAPSCRIEQRPGADADSASWLELTLTFPKGATYVVSGTPGAEIMSETLTIGGLSRTDAEALVRRYAAAEDGIHVDFAKPQESDDRTAWWDPDCNCHVAVLHDKSGKVTGVDAGIAL